MNVKSNVIIFSTDNEERKDVIHRVEEIFGTSKFYIEQLYTWGEPRILQ